MRLINLHIAHSERCSGLLDGVGINFENRGPQADTFSPLCFVGQNGSGKSQVLQILAEIFQAAWHEVDGRVERAAASTQTEFELVVETRPPKAHQAIRAKIARGKRGRVQFTRVEDGAGISPEVMRDILPRHVIGYTSGHNETLSAPFRLSRSEYAQAVLRAADPKSDEHQHVIESALTMVDYSTHLEVLLATQLLLPLKTRKQILRGLPFDGLGSFRIEIDRGVIPGGVRLTAELEAVIERLRTCATCVRHAVSDKPRHDAWVLDFHVDKACRSAFRDKFETAEALFFALYKLDLLNELVLPSDDRERAAREAQSQNFATRLPEPPDSKKIFKIERIRLAAPRAPDTFNYVTLSDGEHQRVQVLGLAAMFGATNTLFLMDEPESHLNPLWRIEFVSDLVGIFPSRARRDLIMTSHAPFALSDMDRNCVLTFKREADRITVSKPDIQTFGATYERILAECFDIAPPISLRSHNTIKKLQDEGDPKRLKEGIDQLGMSFEKAMLNARLARLTAGDKAS